MTDKAPICPKCGVAQVLYSTDEWLPGDHRAITCWFCRKPIIVTKVLVEEFVVVDTTANEQPGR